MLPGLWEGVSRANPILYMINAFRFGVLGVSDIDVGWAFLMIGLFIVGLYAYSMYLLVNSKGLRS